MNKKLIISKTITFIIVIIFVIGFKSIFGEENTLIGVTTITAALMFLERDLTLSPIKNTIKLILINLLIGISSYLVISNMYLGIIINFFTLFLVSYIFCYNLRNPLYLPFSLQYLFLLATPVGIEKFGTRITALVCGAIIIMISQILINKDKLAKSGNKLLENVCTCILDKIEYKDQYDLIEDDLNDVTQYIDDFRTMIYDKREYNYYLTEEGRVKLNLSVALENIHFMIHSTDLDNIDIDIIKTLKILIKEVKSALNQDNSNEHDISLYMQKLFKICEEKDIDDLLNLQLLDSMLLLSDNIIFLKSLDKKEYNLVDKSREISKLFSDSRIKSLFIDKKSIRFCYAMKVAISITICSFIVQYFNLSEGRWILFTLLSLITPVYEVSKTKVKGRVFATIVGSIVVFILFSIFKDSTSRMIIILAAGYLNGYAQQYKYSIIFVTISAIGSAALIENIQVITTTRLLFVFFGVVIAILANKFIFPYKVKDSMIHLENMYHLAIASMFEEVKSLVEGTKQPTTMKNLIVLTSLIDAKSRANEKILGLSSYNKIIHERRSLVVNIYELYTWILRKEVKCQNQKQILSDLNKLINYSDDDIDSKVKQIQDGITISKDINTKIILSSIIVILKELSHLSKLNKSI